MDDNGQRENGKQQEDRYELLQSQWIIPPHLMKDPHALSMKYMSILADRDIAIQERNLALSEKSAALAERDMAVLQRDQAISERNNAMMERDNAMAALENEDNPTVASSSAPLSPPRRPIARGTKVAKHVHQPQHMHHSHHATEALYKPRMHTKDDIQY